MPPRPELSPEVQRQIDSQSKRHADRVIGAHTFRVVYFSVDVAGPLFFRLTEKLGSLVSGLGGDWGLAVRNMGLSDRAGFRAFTDEIFANTQVRIANKWVAVTAVFDDPDLFMGPEGLEHLFELTAHALKVNFAGPFVSSKLALISHVVGLKLARLTAKLEQDDSPAQPTASGTTSDSDSTGSGTSGDLP